MNQQQQTLAQDCLDAANSGAMTFPQIVGALMEGGFESYAIDFRRKTAIYYLPSGDNVEIQTHEVEQPVATTFSPAARGAAIKEAQTLAPGYTYRGSARRRWRRDALAISCRSRGAVLSMWAARPRRMLSIFLMGQGTTCGGDRPNFLPEAGPTETSLKYPVVGGRPRPLLAQLGQRKSPFCS